jgi:hypothetical protein
MSDDSKFTGEYEYVGHKAVTRNDIQKLNKLRAKAAALKEKSKEKK